LSITRLRKRTSGTQKGSPPIRETFRNNGQKHEMKNNNEKRETRVGDFPYFKEYGTFEGGAEH